MYFTKNFGLACINLKSCRNASAQQYMNITTITDKPKLHPYRHALWLENFEPYPPLKLPTYATVENWVLYLYS